MLNFSIFAFKLFIYIIDVDDCGSSASTADSGCCDAILFSQQNWTLVTIIIFQKNMKVKIK